MISIKLKWKAEEGVVEYSKDFLDTYDVLQVDMLSDCIAELQSKHDEILKQFYTVKA
jgi:hypothetical protein